MKQSDLGDSLDPTAQLIFPSSSSTTFTFHCTVYSRMHLTEWSHPDRKLMLNGILRHIYKMRFSFFFQPFHFRFALNLAKSANKSKKCFAIIR
jgi:hypothetical protein